MSRRRPTDDQASKQNFVVNIQDSEFGKLVVWWREQDIYGMLKNKLQGHKDFDSIVPILTWVHIDAKDRVSTKKESVHNWDKNILNLEMRLYFLMKIRRTNLIPWDPWNSLGSKIVWIGIQGCNIFNDIFRKHFIW